MKGVRISRTIRMSYATYTTFAFVDRLAVRMGICYSKARKSCAINDVLYAAKSEPSSTPTFNSTVSRTYSFETDVLTMNSPAARG